MSVLFQPLVRAGLPMTETIVCIVRDRLAAHRDALRDAIEWLAMPVLILYPQLAVLKWYRYGASG